MIFAKEPSQVYNFCTIWSNTSAWGMSGTLVPPEFEELNLTLVERNKVTYVAYAAFDFQEVWKKLQSAGAESINVIPNPETDSLDVEVYFRAPPAVNKRRPYATWQLVLSLICALGITVASQCPPLTGNSG